MPFEVTATRKRPQTFEQLAGQHFVAATLISSLEQGRIAHAYLFSGPRGCGKTSTARILAKALNCEHGPTPHPCGTCSACLSISSGSSLDVIEIDGASNTSVDNIRQIKDEVLFAPHSGRYKIYIIDEVHMLSMSAFNALLKTIEEPPPYIVFIFATTEPQKVPATIKSRCQQFNFRLVPTETIFRLLAQTAAETGVEAEEEALLWIAREAAGSVRDAYTLFDQIASFSGTKITAQNIRDTLGLVGIDRLNELFRAIVSNKTKEAFGVLDEILERGVSPEQFLTDAVDYCRSILLMLHGVEKEGLLSAPKAVFEPFVVESLSKAQIEYAIALLLDTYRHLKETIEPRYELELAVAKLCNIQSYLSPQELFEAIHSVKKVLNVKELPPRMQAGKDAQLPFQSRPANSAEAPNAPLLRDLHPRSAESQRSAEQPNTAGSSLEPEGTDIHTSPAGPVSSSDLRKKIIAKLRNQNLFLASALEKSAEWMPKHNGFIIPATNRVEMDLIARFAPLIAEIGAQMLGTPCAIEARLAKDQESSSFRPSQREATSPASGPKAPLPTPSSPNEKNDEGQVPSVQSAGQESKSSPLAAASFEGTAPDEATENADESENAVYVESSRHAVSSGPQNLTETEMRAIELIRKMFKGKVIATYTAPGASPSESLAPQYPSSSSADTPEYPEDTEAFEGGDEDDFDGY
jgi:DNA polymerase-3 subunit gamma/tau